MTCNSTDEHQGNNTYSLVIDPSSPLYGHITIDPSTGVISPTGAGLENKLVTSAASGPWTFTIHVEDGHDGSDDLTVNLNVTNATPQWTNDSEIYVAHDWNEDHYFDLQTTDETSDNLGQRDPTLYNHYELVSVTGALAGHVTLTDAKNGTIAINPEVSVPNGDYSITVKFNDGTADIFQTITAHVTDGTTSGSYTPPTADEVLRLRERDDICRGRRAPSILTSRRSFENITGHDITYSLENVPAVCRAYFHRFDYRRHNLGRRRPTNKDVTYWPDLTPQEQPYEFLVRVHDSAYPDPVNDQSATFVLHVTEDLPQWDPALPSTLTFTEAHATEPYNPENTDEGDGAENMGPVHRDRRPDGAH